MAEHFYYYPLTRRGSRYVEDHIREAVLESEFAADLSSGFDEQDAVVDIGGSVFHTRVWVHPDGQRAFVAANSDRLPRNASPWLKANQQALVRYARSIATTLAQSEFVAPENPESLWVTFLQPNVARVGDEGQTEFSWEQLRSESRVILLGPPGAGKTTALRRLAREILDDNERSEVPVYLQCRGLADMSLKEAVVSAVQQHEPELARNPENQLSSGAWSLFLDGLDEAPANRRARLIAEVADWCNVFPRVRVIVSTREAAYSGALNDRFTRTRLLPFTDSQMYEWAYHRMGPRNEWTSFVSHVMSSEAVREVCTRPLLLSICEQVFRRTSPEPPSQYSMLEASLNSLVETWDASRGVQRFERPWATPARKTAVLCRAAFNSLLSTDRGFSQTDFSSWERAYWPSVESPEVLHRLECENGIVASESGTQWSFSFRALQEFLAAKFLVESTVHASTELTHLALDAGSTALMRHACALTPDATPLADALLRTYRSSPALVVVFAADLLNGDVTLRDTLADKLVKMIVAWAESMFGEASVLSEASNRHDPVIWHWAVELADVSESAQRTAGLLKSVHRASGDLAEHLRRSLQASALPAVRSLATLIGCEGILSISIEPTPAGARVEGTVRGVSIRQLCEDKRSVPNETGPTSSRSPPTRST